MREAERTVAHIKDSSNFLVTSSTLQDDGLVRDFCGSVTTLDDFSSGTPDLRQKTVYLCGDISRFSGHQFEAAARVFVVRELSHGYDDADGEPWSLVGLGQVPIRVHPEGMIELRRLYAEENKTQGLIDYGDRILFSMNTGDYLAPRA